MTSLSRAALPRVLGACLTAAIMATAATASEWTMTPESSSLRFEGTQTQSAFTGQFRRFDTQITLDPEDLSTASIAVTIDITSFASGSPDRDSEALSLDWFNTRNFPQATFTSDDVTHVEGNSYLARGTLAIKAVEREIELPFTLDVDGGRAVADGSIVLDRLDYDVRGGGEYEEDSFVGHAVTVNFHVVATR